MRQLQDDIHNSGGIGYPAHTADFRQKSLPLCAEAISTRLREREERLTRACEIANHDADVIAIEQDWEKMRDTKDHI